MAKRPQHSRQIKHPVTFHNIFSFPKRIIHIPHFGLFGYMRIILQTFRKPIMYICKAKNILRPYSITRAVHAEVTILTDSCQLYPSASSILCKQLQPFNNLHCNYPLTPSATTAIQFYFLNS